MCGSGVLPAGRFSLEVHFAGAIKLKLDIHIIKE